MGKKSLLSGSHAWSFGYPRPMSIESIVAQIDAEIAQLTKVRTLLTSKGAVSAKPAKSATTKLGKPKKRRILSADARKRIADAQRRRWAAQKAKAK